MFALALPAPLDRRARQPPACASAGLSLMPSPTMATPPPPRCCSSCSPNSQQRGGRQAFQSRLQALQALLAMRQASCKRWHARNTRVSRLPATWRASERRAGRVLQPGCPAPPLNTHTQLTPPPPYTHTHPDPPTHTPHPPRTCTLATLPAGMTSAATSVMPSWPAMALAVRQLSPVSSTQCRPMPCSADTTPLASGLSGS